MGVAGVAGGQDLFTVNNLVAGGGGECGGVAAAPVPSGSVLDGSRYH